MKLLVLITLLFSSSVFACPNISGFYSCLLNGVTTLKDIKQTTTGYIITTEGSEMEYFTDGMGYEIPATDSYKNATVTSSCRREQFIVDFKATILYEGSEIAKEVSKTTYGMQGEDLIILRKTKMKGFPLPTQKYLCTKN